MKILLKISKIKLSTSKVGKIPDCREREKNNSLVVHISCSHESNTQMYIEGFISPPEQWTRQKENKASLQDDLLCLEKPTSVGFVFHQYEILLLSF